MIEISSLSMYYAATHYRRRSSPAMPNVMADDNDLVGTHGVLIVGGGQAAVQLATALRDLGWTGPVTIASEEPHAPYNRPPLSKAFLSGRADAASLAFRDDDFYPRAGITLLRSARVTRLRPGPPPGPGGGAAPGRQAA
jgi:hypothetical protein